MLRLAVAAAVSNSLNGKVMALPSIKMEVDGRSLEDSSRDVTQDVLVILGSQWSVLKPTSSYGSGRGIR